MLAFFRNDMGFGGNNGLTDFKDVLGFDLQADDTRAALFALTALILRRRLPALPVHRRLAARQGADLDPRRGEPGAFPRLPGRVLQAVRLRRLGGDGGDRRRALRAAGGHHQSLRVRAGNSIEIVIWVAIGGRGTLHGAILGAILVNYLKTWFTGAIPELWLFALGGLFIAVTLFLPKGVIGLFGHGMASASDRGPRGSDPDAGEAERAGRMTSLDPRPQPRPS